MRRRCNSTRRLVAEAGWWRLARDLRPNVLARLATSFAVFWFLLTCQISQPLAQIVSSPRELAVIRINVLDLLVHEENLPLPVKQRRDALWEYYQVFSGELLWLGSRRPDELLARLQNAASDGLDPKDYPSKQLAKLAAAKSTDDKRSLALVELFFSAAFLEYASDIKVGRFLPRKVDPNFFIEARTIDQTAALKSLATVDSLDRFFDAWQPSNPRYAALRASLVNYLALADKGGWNSVPLGESLKPGMKDPRVPAIRTRLSVTDGVRPSSAEPEIYDDTLADAVKRFQARQGLDSDGVVGPSTIVAMNVPIQERIQSIVMAMERLRWMPDDLGQQYVIVNIAGFDLRRINGGNVEEQMAVVVGKPYHRTPVFSDRIRYVEFNPYWTVPPAILANEELPKLRKNPASLSAQGFEVVRGNQVVDPTSIDWSRYGGGNLPFQLRQRPGANNALGSVKLMFPNEHNVYLHDSPARSLFSRNVRAFSHGCIRLARPLDLAEQVLRAGGVAGWNRNRIDQVVASTKNTVVNLQNPLPVHITYMTAWADGKFVNFRPDIYGHDAKLLAALDGKSIAW
ncbi:MAG TPA: L,D-transpeptidase family protein [Pseudolabrys sp.]|nr:L,D-transpeptidase family protein [Pseudolabrys sp.]